MPPRKKETTEEATEPERRSTRIRDMPTKPPPAAPAAQPAKRAKKTDPELSEWKPTKKASSKKRKKADLAAEDAEDAEDAKTKDVEAEEKPKKKVKTEAKATKGKKAAAGKEGAAPAAASTSEAATAQPAAQGGNEAKKEHSALTIGSALPQMILKNEKGDNVDLSTLASQNGVVIFASPKADTPGCNKQSCHFRDSTADFTKLGYDVYGLTSDTPAALTKWKTKNSFQYTLLSDPNREFIAMLGAKTGNATKRSHFVFERETGKLLDAQIGVKPDTSHSAALEFIKGL
ncbi:hypothetical protein FRC14_001575 [Serendipita sp. 396]|nr:hypothetical protein FRC14_001575 [Serendipita sp. 396]KAG8785189.1 hypothetical protein FRC15_001846 [Serendipita sp. 397]KAG8800799.1 hypothetical protein FRC16_002079 [Serendipita sp. 398]KAG8824285.1 hypothetical protein FRC19_002117 [Serendipita sp. 401]KAG8857875.1 hypothetical protein FRB91_010717 [Serendipita sp. 411]KAG8869526.1 hypothetical protein FRC20_001274 [Serendipita sp. 405]KAG9055311.1 hypothetical protein FS842_002564 [Serendipita sp. 407]